MEENIQKKDKNNYLKAGVQELNANMSKLFSNDKSSGPEKIDSNLSDFEDEILKNFKPQKEDEIMESTS